MMKKLLSLIVAVCLLLSVTSVAVFAENSGDFVASVTIVTESDKISVTVVDSPALADRKPTLTVDCAFAQAYVTLGSAGVASTLEDGKITFPVAAGGTYVIHSGKAPVVTPDPVPTPDPDPVQPSQPVVQPSAPGEDVVVTPNVIQQGSTAQSTVTAAAGSQLVQQAAKADSANVVVAPAMGSNVTKAEVTLPAATVSALGRETDAALTVQTPVAQVAIPNEALSDLGQQGGNLTVAAEQDGDAVILTVSAAGKPLTELPEGVKASIPAQEITPNTVAVLVHEDGTREVIRKSVAQDGLVTLPLEGSAKIEIVDNAKTFTDAPTAPWAAEAVAFASSHELLNGTDVGIFSPNVGMTRAMLAQVLHNMEKNEDADVEITFPDTSSHWAGDAISWAAGQGIVGGYDNGQFGADDPITREQLVTMLWRYVGSPASDARLTNPDAGKVSPYAAEAMAWAVEMGIITGKTNGVIDPQGAATRVEVAAVLMRLLKIS